MKQTNLNILCILLSNNLNQNKMTINQKQLIATKVINNNENISGDNFINYKNILVDDITSNKDREKSIRFSRLKMLK